MASPFMGAPAVPSIAQAPVAPAPNDMALAQAKLSNLQALMSQSGRESTMMSQQQGQSNKLGG